MKNVEIGDIFQVSDTKFFKGTHRVEVVRDTRGGVGGGISVKSLENNQESSVLNEELFFYRPWDKYITHTGTVFISAVIGAVVTYILKK